MRKIAKKLIASSLLLSLVTLSTSAFAEEKSISELKDKQGNINSSIQANKGKLKATEDKKIKTLDDLRLIKKEISETKDNIKKLSEDIKEKTKDIETIENKISEMQQKLEKKIEDYNLRLVEVYKEGDVKYLDILFGAEDFNDFLTRYQYIQYINDSDQSLMDEIKEYKATLKEEQDKVKQVKADLEAAKQNKEAQTIQLAQMGESKKALISELTVQEKAIQKSIRDMEQASNAIGAQIQALQAQASRLAQGDVVGYQGAYVPVGGALTFPVPSYYGVTSEYGWRGDPFSGGQSFHMGIDLGASSGASVLSAGDGKIILQEYHWSYGNYVVVDHGNGLSTVYAHMTGFAKPFGSIVKAGEEIGYVGSTGSSTGPHLHFEVRVNGQHTNPRGYLGI